MVAGWGRVCRSAGRPNVRILKGRCQKDGSDCRYRREPGQKDRARENDCLPLGTAGCQQWSVREGRREFYALSGAHSSVEGGGEV